MGSPAFRILGFVDPQTNDPSIQPLALLEIFEGCEKSLNSKIPN
jgi:hypothetical protein